MTIYVFHPIALILLGWLAGTTVNLLADWLSWSSLRPIFKCNYCGKKYSYVNYIFWFRRCPTCGKGSKNRVWFVEMFYIIATILMWYHPSTALNFALSLITLIYFGVIFVIDLEHKIINTSLLILGVPLGMLMGIAHNDLEFTLLGGVAGFLLTFLIYLLGFLFSKYMAKFKRTNMSSTAFGYGDVLLGGVLGLMVGWPEVFTSLFSAILSAGLFSGIFILFMLLRRQYIPGKVIPYAPFLVIGAVSVLYF